MRYEGQVKARQQKELADSIIAKIEKELEDPKVLKKILDQSIADVESKSYPLDWYWCIANSFRRNPGSESVVCTNARSKTMTVSR